MAGRHAHRPLPQAAAVHAPGHPARGGLPQSGDAHLRIPGHPADRRGAHPGHGPGVPAQPGRLAAAHVHRRVAGHPARAALPHTLPEPRRRRGPDAARAGRYSPDLRIPPDRQHHTAAAGHRLHAGRGRAGAGGQCQAVRFGRVHAAHPAFAAAVLPARQFLWAGGACPRPGRADALTAGGGSIHERIQPGPARDGTHPPGRRVAAPKPHCPRPGTRHPARAEPGGQRGAAHHRGLLCPAHRRDAATPDGRVCGPPGRSPGCPFFPPLPPPHRTEPGPAWRRA